MSRSGKIITSLLFFIIFLSGCQKTETYPDIPHVKFKNHTTYLTTDDLGNKIALVKLDIEFTDGDGNIGLKEPVNSEVPDSVKYNLFLTLYDYSHGSFKKVETLDGTQNYRIPFIKREGQNKTLKGDIFIDLEYKSIIYDTIFYSFYLTDRDYNKSNLDSTDVIVLSGIDLHQ